MSTSPPFISEKTGLLISPSKMPIRLRDSNSYPPVPTPVNCTEECEIPSIVANATLPNIDDCPSCTASIGQSDEHPKVTEMGDAKCGWTPPVMKLSPVEKEQMRPIFVHKKVKAATPTRWREKRATEVHLKRLGGRKNNKPSVQMNQSKLRRSSTFSVPKRFQGKGGSCGDKTNTKMFTISNETPTTNRSLPLKTADMNSRSMPKISSKSGNGAAKVNERGMGLVKMNRSAVLRLEFMKQGGKLGK